GQAAGGTHTFIESGHGPAIPVEQSVKPPTAPDGGASLPELSGYTDNTVFELAPRRKYSKSGLSEDMASRIHRELGILMETEKLYTESELSLADLATKLSVHPNYLSQVINEKEGRNFYDYINTLRIEAFKKLVTKPGSQKYTILSLAYDCGFNSKSSFNRFFKKITGQSPSEYIDSLALSEAV
ncbi:MAG TPA: helix-turn-helix domain-containing protein, partial [Flavisolibacter sp.]